MRGTGRTHDDCDGDLSQRLELLQSDDGDMHISTDGVTFLRFRMPIIGGGLSEHTYDALRVLFDAIEQDNKDRPLVQRCLDCCGRGRVWMGLECEIECSACEGAGLSQYVANAK